MIQELNGFSKKSFKNYSTSKDFFREKNIIFGYNGRGKSSLAEGLIEAFYTSETLSGKFRYFNRDYIKENLILEDKKSSGVLKGVTATFSKKDIDNKNKIENLENSLIDKDRLVQAVSTLEGNTRKIIDLKHDSKKGNLNINKKPKSMPVHDIVKLYRRDYLDALKIQSDENKLILYQGDNSVDMELNQIETLRLPNLSINQLSTDDYNKIFDIFSEKYGSLDIPQSNIIEWLNTGLDIHQEGDDCKFCGNQMSYQKIEAKILEYNQNEKQKAEVYLKDKMTQLSEELASIERESDKNIVENLKSHLNGSVLDKIFSEIHENLKVIKNAVSQMNYKISMMGQAVEFNRVELAGSLDTINKANTRLYQLKKEKVDKVRSISLNQNTLVKGAVGLSVINDVTIQTNLEEIEQKRKEIELARKSNEDIKKEITSLQNQTTDHEDFRRFLNEVLKSIEIDLELVSHHKGENYTLQHSKIPHTPLVIEDISEGEKNLLALLFFYFELYNDNEQKELKGNIELIVIDDPVSSLDEANKFYVLEMMKKLLDEKRVQLFILTHVWNDFCQLAYGKSKNEKVKTAEVYKNSTSNSEVRELKTNINPYRKLFKEIYEFSQKGEILS